MLQRGSPQIPSSVASELMAAMDSPGPSIDLVAYRVPTHTYAAIGNRVAAVLDDSISIKASTAAQIEARSDHAVDSRLGCMFQWGLTRYLNSQGLIGNEALLQCASKLPSEAELTLHCGDLDFWAPSRIIEGKGFCPPIAIEIKTLFSRNSIPNASRRCVALKFIPFTGVLRKNWPELSAYVILIHARHLIRAEPLPQQFRRAICPLDQLASQLQSPGDRVERRQVGSADSLGIPPPLYIRLDGAELLNICQQEFPDFDSTLRRLAAILQSSALPLPE